MALYKTHVKFNVIFTFPISIFLLLYFLKPSFKETIFFSSSFLYATLFMSPDVDLAHKNSLFSLKGILTMPFRIYSLLFKHRGISHMPIVGSFTRIFFLSIFIIFIFYVFDISTFKKIDVMKIITKNPYIHFCIAGIILSDLSHLLLDIKKN